MKRYINKSDDHIDTLHIIFYVGDTIKDNILMSMRNKKIIKQWSGVEATQLYNLLSQKEHK